MTLPLVLCLVWLNLATGELTDSNASRFFRFTAPAVMVRTLRRDRLHCTNSPWILQMKPRSALLMSVYEQLKTGDMPPSGYEEQPSKSARDEILIDRQLLTAGSGEAYRKKLLSPEYGNWVDHEKLFSGEIQTPPFSPPRLWRLSPEIFAHKGFGNSESPYTYITSERGIRDYSATSIADQSTVQMSLIVADAFLAERERRGEFKAFAEGPTPPAKETLEGIVNRVHASHRARS